MSDFSITTTYGALNEALSAVLRFVPKRPPVPAVGAVVVTALGAGATVRSCGYDVTATAQLKGVGNTEYGAVGFIGHDLAKVMKAAAKGSTVARMRSVPVTIESAHVVIDGYRYKVETVAADAVPSEWPTTEQPGAVDVVADGAQFASLLPAVLKSAGSDDTLPMLTGVRFEMANDCLTLAATDRFRLTTADVLASGDDFEALAPADVLSDWLRLHKKAPATVRITTIDGLMSLNTPALNLTLRLLDVEFVKWRSLVEMANRDTVVTVDRAALATVNAKVGATADRGYHTVYAVEGGAITGYNDTVTATALLADVAGPNLLIAFNPGYFGDALASFDTDKVTLSFGTHSRPLLVTADSVPLTVLVMPARLPSDVISDWQRNQVDQSAAVAVAV